MADAPFHHEIDLRASWGLSDALIDDADGVPAALLEHGKPAVTFRYDYGFAHGQCRE